MDPHIAWHIWGAKLGEKGTQNWAGPERRLGACGGAGGCSGRKSTGVGVIAACARHHLKDLSSFSPPSEWLSRFFSPYFTPSNSFLLPHLSLSGTITSEWQVERCVRMREFLLAKKTGRQEVVFENHERRDLPFIWAKVTFPGSIFQLKKQQEDFQKAFPLFSTWSAPSQGLCERPPADVCGDLK